MIPAPDNGADARSRAETEPAPDAGDIRCWIVALQHEDAQTRHRAADALGEIGDPAAVRALLEAVRDPNAYVRRQAARALGQIGDASAVPGLIGALNDDRHFVREQGVEALARIGAASVSGLADALREQNPAARFHIVEALGSIGDVSAVPALIDALSDTNPYVRQSAAGALGDLGDAESLPHKVLAATRLPVAQRIAILETLGNARYRQGRLFKNFLVLSYPVLPLERYCRSLLDREDIEEEARVGAKVVLAYRMLVRPRASGQLPEPDELLHLSSPDEAAASPSALGPAVDASAEETQGPRSSPLRMAWERLTRRR
jgi:hypothetical protein